MMFSIRLFRKQCHRECLIHFRQFKHSVNVCLFFVMLMVFFPLTLPAEPQLMRTIAPGIVWMAMLLSLLLSAERMFQMDYEQGVIEQWLVSGESLYVMVISRVGVHWLMTIIPVLLLCPLIAVLFSLSIRESVILGLSLLCGTPAIIFLCALAAVFSLGAHQKGAFMGLVLLPLTLPVMVFGSAALAIAMQDLAVDGYLMLLLAMSILAVSFLPFAIAAVIRISLAD